MAGGNPPSAAARAAFELAAAAAEEEVEGDIEWEVFEEEDDDLSEGECWDDECKREWTSFCEYFCEPSNSNISFWTKKNIHKRIKLTKLNLKSQFVFWRNPTVYRRGQPQPVEQPQTWG